MRKLLVILTVVLQFSCGAPTPEKPKAAQPSDPYPMSEDALAVSVTGEAGGRIITAMLNDPETFHPLLFSTVDSQTFNQLMHPGLTRLNPATQQPEPSLAKSWESSEDHLTWTFHLRKGLTWSDGQPFGAHDVLFTMQVVNDPKIVSSAQDALTLNSRPVAWKQIDELTVTATLPSPFASFLRQLDGGTTPILAKHKWETPYHAGTFEQQWQVSMNPEDFVGIGPFLLKEYFQGQTVRLFRNPRYWKRDGTGRRLPYLDEIIFQICSDLNQLQLKIQNGEIDTYYSIRGEDVERFQQKSSSTGMNVIAAGPSQDFEGVILNQNTDKNPKTGKPYIDPVKTSWFTDVNFRRAISYGINREALVQNAYFGKAIPSYGPESVSNKLWYNEKIMAYPYDPLKTLELLQASGFQQKKDSTGSVKLFDSKGHQVRFSMHTNAGNTTRSTECLLIAGDLLKLGIQVDYSPLDFNTLATKVTETFDYDAILLSVSHDDTDPAGGMNVMLSSGTTHLWWPQQKFPHTEWEKRIDELMNLQFKTFSYEERKGYYNEVQRILSDQQPMVYTVTPLIFVCAKTKIGNLHPVVARHRTLWNAEELYWKKAKD